MVEQETITEDEAALYDRQIRLWGLDAQRRFVDLRWTGLKGGGGCPVLKQHNEEYE